MKSADIRKLFLDYFRQHGHEPIVSSPLVPANDPTLLFTNAGMVQFKEVFTGQDKRSYKRATSSQRCVRAGGKHNDLENVGYTARHHTFFEMLGNFSFGDYFKRDAIQFAWEFLTEVAKLPAERLWITVYSEDDEAADIWLNDIGIDPARLSRIGDKPGGKAHESDNFWAMGDTGPCGPCSEIFYDHGPDVAGGPPGTPEEDGDRYIEIWNLVFMQFDRDAEGNMNRLPHPSVDTGMGLERLAAVLQGVHNNYDIDLFQHLIAAAAKLTGTNDYENKSLRVIADHIRACAFLITDSVIPSNEGRGYVLRRIIRRAIRHGYQLGMRDAFFYKLVSTLCDEMGDAYPELIESQDRITNMLKQEEERFLETIENGMRILGYETGVENFVFRWLAEKPGLKYTAINWVSSEGWQFDGQFERNGKQVPVYVLPLSSVSQQKSDQIYTSLYSIKNSSFKDFEELFIVVVTETSGEEVSGKLGALIEGMEFPHKLYYVSKKELRPFRYLRGEVAFKLHDTYGFPLDLTQDACRELDVSVDVAGFEAAMDAQREQARAASSFGAASSDGLTVSGQTEFTGYEHLQDSGKVVALFRDGAEAEQLAAGDEGLLQLDRTPFYAESGGQAGDRGVLVVGNAQLTVLDTQKQGDAFLHRVKVQSGSVATGVSVEAKVDVQGRQDTACNHSATHLLHAALRQVLGEHVQQKGSLVEAERLRFDFSHFEAITPEQLAEIEALVNSEIRGNVLVETSLMSQDEAVASGAMALFGEKYGDVVRVLRMGEFSVELCGGTHVTRTGDIGLFKITSEGGVAAGVRRIEAVAGQGALRYIGETEKNLAQIASLLKADSGAVETKVQQLIDRSRSLEKELEQLKARLASSQGGDLAAQAVEVGGIKVLAAKLEGGDAKSLRDTVDQLKNKLGVAAVLLAAVDGNKVSLVAGVTKAETKRVRAGDLVNYVAQQVGGKGGGRPDLAMAGGKDPSGLEAALQAVPDWVQSQLAEQ